MKDEIDVSLPEEGEFINFLLESEDSKAASREKLQNLLTNRDKVGSEKVLQIISSLEKRHPLEGFNLGLLNFNPGKISAPVFVKTKQLMYLCWALMDGLNDDKFGIKRPDLLCVLFNGLSVLFNRFLTSRIVTVEHKRSPEDVPPEDPLDYYIFEVFSFKQTGFAYWDIGTKINVDGMGVIYSRPDCRLEIKDFIQSIHSQIKNIPYPLFSDFFIRYFKDNLHQFRTQAGLDAIENKNQDFIQLVALTFLLRMPFLSAAEDIIPHENKILAVLKASFSLPGVLVNLIYGYLTTSATCFFNEIDEDGDDVSEVKISIKDLRRIIFFPTGEPSPSVFSNIYEQRVTGEVPRFLCPPIDEAITDCFSSSPEAKFHS